MSRKIKKAYEITDAKIQFVSLVDKAANKRKFLLSKAENGQGTFTTYGRIVKKDSDNHYVTGIVYEPLEEDSHGNFMTEDEITKAAYWFAKNGENVDVQHSFEPLEGATVVENWIAKADFDIGGEQIKKGTWLMTVEVTDEDVWNKIDNGEITGFSMGGIGNYSEEDIELEKVSKQKTQREKGLFKQLAKALSPDVVEKGDNLAEKKTSDKSKETLQGIYDNLGAFLAEFENKTDNSKEITPEDDGKSKKEDNEMTKQEVEEIVEKYVAEAFAKLKDNSGEGKGDEQTKSDEKEVAKSEPITAEKVDAMVQTAIEKALTPQETVTAEQIQKMIDDAIEPVLKSKGLPTNLNGNNTVKKSGEHYLHGIL